MWASVTTLFCLHMLKVFIASKPDEVLGDYLKSRTQTSHHSPQLFQNRNVLFTVSKCRREHYCPWKSFRMLYTQLKWHQSTHALPHNKHFWLWFVTLELLLYEGYEQQRLFFQFFHSVMPRTIAFWQTCVLEIQGINIDLFCMLSDHMSQVSWSTTIAVHSMMKKDQGLWRSCLLNATVMKLEVLVCEAPSLRVFLFVKDWLLPFNLLNIEDFLPVSWTFADLNRLKDSLVIAGKGFLCHSSKLSFNLVKINLKLSKMLLIKFL